VRILDSGAVGLRIRPADLRRLRYGQTVSMYGDAVTAVALPTVALLVVQVTPFEFGLLGATTYLAYPFLGLQAGAWVDRVRRRRVMILADATRFLATVSIPVAAVFGVMSIAQLFVVGLLVGVASVFFDAAYQAYLPSIVGKDQIAGANVKLSVSETSAQVAGPPLAGFLINAVGAAPTLVLDALSFLASIVSLAFIRRVEEAPGQRRKVEPPPQPLRRARRPPRKSLRREVRAGLRVLFGDRLLRGLTLTSALSNLGRGMCIEMFLLFAYNGLHLSAGVASTVLAMGNVGSLSGSLTCARVTKALGLGAALRIGSLMKGLPWLFAPLTLIGPPLPISVAIIVVSSYFIPISNVTVVSIRQSMVSPELQGRVASTSRTITMAVIPLAAVLGGVLAQLGTELLGARAGLAAVLVVGGLIWMSATVLLPRRRLDRIRTLADLERGEQPAADARLAMAAANGAASRGAPPQASHRQATHRQAAHRQVAQRQAAHG
jgi:MFS family permease